MSLNELVDMYNQKLNSDSSQSRIAADSFYHVPQSTFSTNTGLESAIDSTNVTMNNQDHFAFTDSATSALLFEADSTRLDLNDRVLAGEIIQPTSQNRPRIERTEHADKIVFSSDDIEVDEYENNEEYATKYSDIKTQLNIINARQAKLPPIDMFTNPGEQIQRLIDQGKLKNLHGYINYPYNYLEPPWHFSSLEEQQGYVNLNPPRPYLMAQDIELNTVDYSDEIELPYGVPQESVMQNRYELIPLPKMVYENFVPLIATRRIICRRQTSERVAAEPSSQQKENSFGMTSKLPEIEEMTFKF